MKKYMLDWKIKENIFLQNGYFLLKLTLEVPIPESLPGQFVQIQIKNSENFFLRRPISIHYVDKENNDLWLLIKIIGEGTRKLSKMKSNELISLIFPLGKGFTIPQHNRDRIEEKILLLVGGGIGVAPLLYFGAYLKDKGITPTFLFGAKTSNDFLQLKEFKAIGKVYLITENGSLGEEGLVMNHSILQQHKIIDFIYSCGPRSMMKSIAQYARKYSIHCEVSLENTMACGIGACFCCVEKTIEGNACVCTEGPVFNINKLTWQI